MYIEILIKDFATHTIIEDLKKGHQTFDDHLSIRSDKIINRNSKIPQYNWDK